MLAAKDEKHAMTATLWFNVAHYGLRPWPWILVALASLLVYPNLDSIQQAFPHVSPGLIGHDMAYPAMLKFLPAGLLGLMVASLLAAYISTMDTHLNWGASYLVHDLYRRFIKPEASEKHYVLVSRLVTVGLMILAAALMFLLETARESFELLLSIGAGTGLIYLLRWFWWRINAWSEISAMASSFLIAFGLFIAQKKGVAIPNHLSLVISVGITTLFWLTITLLTKPTDEKKLLSFYQLVRPMGKGWHKIREKAQLPPSPDSLPQALFGWVLGCVLVYSALFSLGNFLYGQALQGGILLLPALASGIGLTILLRQMYSQKKK